MRCVLVGSFLVACGRRDASPPPPAPVPAKEARGPVERCPVDEATVGAGLTRERWHVAATPAAGGEPCVEVVRADLRALSLRVLRSDSHEPRTAPAWTEDFRLAAVTNAGMFHESGQPVGLIVDHGAATGTDNPKMSGYLAWDPVAPGDPPAVIAGKDCPDFDLAALRRRYRSLIQSYRLLGCDGHALPWQDPKHYSAAAIGLDRAGHVVLLHARAAFTMAELATALAAHDLTGALFLEGGPEASLVAGSLARVGSFETGFVENDDNRAFWNLPNVIALARR